MKYCISSPKENLHALPGSLGEVFVSRPLRIGSLKILVEEKGVERIFCSKSCSARLSAKARKYLEGKGVGLVMDSFRGKPLSLTPEQILKFSELRKDGLSYRKIAECLGISKSTAHYLHKYAKKTKIKNRGKILQA